MILAVYILHRNIGLVDGMILEHLCVLKLSLAFFALLSPIPSLITDVSNRGSTLWGDVVECFLVILRIGRRQRRRR